MLIAVATIAVLLSLGRVASAVWPDVHGDLYAFDARDGTVLWHARFPGVEPSLSFAGDAVIVGSGVGEGCEPGHVVLSTFNRRTGVRLGELPTGAPESGDSREVTVAEGVVGYRGRGWRARVPIHPPDRPLGVRHRDVVFVAVPGRWKHPCEG